MGGQAGGHNRHGGKAKQHWDSIIISLLRGVGRLTDHYAGNHGSRLEWCSPGCCQARIRILPSPPLPTSAPLCI
jgi:hypothetical protein